ncbi:hypothetical protein FAIPA1_50022 [Frankia sp. AiPs1]|nr:Na+/H+ antiporter NhaA [Frankia sp. AiPa1]MCL9760153.1 Na+/H+ antiporter NhaA [Frankia sp. AiPa1]
MHVPTSVRAFLLGLAVVDDLGAIALIAILFTVVGQRRIGRGCPGGHRNAAGDAPGHRIVVVLPIGVASSTAHILTGISTADARAHGDSSGNDFQHWT